MRYLLIILCALFFSFPAYADCPPAPMSHADDMILRFPVAQGIWAGSASGLASDAINPKTNVEGVVVYNGTSKTLMLCNGEEWVALSGGIGGGTGGGVIIPETTADCTPELEGAQRYNSTKKTMEFCNGASWFALYTQGIGPSPFAFPDVANSPLNEEINSANVVLSGFMGPMTATCTDCIAIARNGAWSNGTTRTGYMAGDSIAIRRVSSGITDTTTTATVSVGTTSSAPWKITTTGGACSEKIAPGFRCSDGTVFVGLTPDGYKPLYAAPCDIGMTWNAGTQSCTGTATPHPWNNTTDNTNWQSWPDLGGVMENCSSGNSPGCIKGKEMSAYLATLTAWPGPYQAARHCENLSAVGHSDWYLPALNEMLLAAATYTADTHYRPASQYWTSTESSGAWANYVNIENASRNSAGKDQARYIRCTRVD